MKLQGKVFCAILSILIVFSLTIGVMQYVFLTKDADTQITRFREQQTNEVKRALKNYVDIAYNTIESNYQNSQDSKWLEKQYGSRLINIIELAEGIIKENQKLVSSGTLSKHDAQQQAIKAISQLRYNNGSGYVWINDTGKPYPKMIMHPTVPALNGKLLDNPKYNCALGKKQNLFQAAVDVTAADGGGFVDYLWPKPTQDGLTEEQPKLSYVRLIPKWNWVLGTGIYVDDALLETIEKTKHDIEKMRYSGGTGYFWINDMGKPYPKMVVHPTVPALNGKLLDNPKYNCALGKKQNLFQAGVEACVAAGEGFVDYLWPKPTKNGLTKEQPKLSYVKSFEPLGWVIGSGIYIDSIDTAVAEKAAETKATTLQLLKNMLYVVVIMLLVLVFLIRYATNRFFINEIKRSVKFAKEVANGDFTQQLSCNTKDEIGDLINALNRMSLKLGIAFKDIYSSVQTLSSSSTELSTISAQMSSNSSDTSKNVHTVVTASEEMSMNMESVAAASEETSVNVNIVAAAAEEMSTTIVEIGSNTEKTRFMAESAVSKAKNASLQINELGQAAKEIGKVTEAITEISEQTNLLALNATIEAARAGEAGKGFAVVANEIKDLAKQTSDATTEITDKISKIQNATSLSVTEIAEIAEVISEVSEMISTVAITIEEQTSATQEISENVSQASHGIQEVNENVAQASTAIGAVASDIAGVGQSSDEIKASSNEVNVSATALREMSAKLADLVNQFKI